MSASPRDWADPYLEQAKEDLEAARALSIEKTPSTFCMMMQMVFEKLAKCAYARKGNLNTTNHRIVEKLKMYMELHTVREVRDLFHNNKSVWLFIVELEAANPAVAGQIAKGKTPCLEYPWEDMITGLIKYPARDHHLIKRVQDPKYRAGLASIKIAGAIAGKMNLIAP